MTRVVVKFPDWYGVLNYYAQKIAQISMFSNISDESLMHRYREGDLSAFNELYQRHARGLYMFVLWRSPRKEWVEEIIQETWCGLHTAKNSYQHHAQFRTFLFKIARNKLIDQIRLHKNVELATDLGVAEDGSQVFDHIADVEQYAPTPMDVLDNKQQLEWLKHAIRSLPSEQREALALQQFSGMSLAEIAEITITSVETTKSRLRYAIQKLRSQAQLAIAQGHTV